MGLDNDCVCGKSEEEHRTFAFASVPSHHRGAYPCAPEWLPNVDNAHDVRIDDYPARVAYQFNDGEPTVQVFQGSDEGLWTVCSCTNNAAGAIDWHCVPKGPKNPCGDTFMRDIST